MSMTKKEIIARWADFENSAYRKKMKDGYKYFYAHNDIEDRVRKEYSYDDTNSVVEVESKKTNNRLVHSFLELLVSQKVAYGLAKKFTIDYVDDDQKEKFNRLEKILSKKYLTRKFYALLKEAGIDSRVAGRAILYKYYENGELKFLRYNPLDCCLVWEDDFTQEKLRALIRHYTKVDFSSGRRTEVHYLECYERDGITTIKRSEENPIKIFTDGWSSPQIKPYGTRDTGKAITDIDFSDIPFVIMKNGFAMKQDLEQVKSLIDDYDRITSENSNDICDIPNAIKVVKGYTDDTKEEFNKNVRLFNTAFVDADGDITSVVTPLAIDQVDIHLKRVRRDIFDCGHGVDVKENNFNDLSGVALKNLYEPVDSEFNDWAVYIEEALEKIIDSMIYDIKKNGGEDFSDIDYNIVFNVDMLLNEKEIAEIATLYKGILSPETLAANASWSKNAEKEVEGVKKQLEFQNELQGEVKQAQQANNVHNTAEQVKK